MCKKWTTIPVSMLVLLVFHGLKRSWVKITQHFPLILLSFPLPERKTLPQQHSPARVPYEHYLNSGPERQATRCAASALLVLPPNTNKPFPRHRDPPDSGWIWHSTELFCHYTHKLQHKMWTTNGLMFIYLFGLVWILCFGFFFLMLWARTLNQWQGAHAGGSYTSKFNY